MTYKEEYKELERVVNSNIDSGNYDEAIMNLSLYVGRFLVPKYFGFLHNSYLLDGLCQKIANELKKLQKLEPQKLNQNCDNLVILTTVPEVGGHLSLIKDLIKSQIADSKFEIIVTNYLSTSCECRKFFEQEHQNINYSFFDSDVSITEILKLYDSNRYRNIYIVNNNHDAKSVILGILINGVRKIFLHHGDYALCIGTTIDEFEHIDFHAIGYVRCKKLGINNRFEPIKIENRRKIDICSNEGFMTATCGRYEKFSNAEECILDLIPEIIELNGVGHIHIGAIPAVRLASLRDSLKKKNVLEKFTYIEHTNDLMKEFISYNVALLVNSYPLGGGYVVLDAMSIGIPIVSFDNRNLCRTSGRELIYPEAFTVRNNQELLDLISNVTLNELRAHSLYSYNFSKIFGIPDLSPYEEYKVKICEHESYIEIMDRIESDYLNESKRQCNQIDSLREMLTQANDELAKLKGSIVYKTCKFFNLVS